MINSLRFARGLHEARIRCCVACPSPPSALRSRFAPCATRPDRRPGQNRYQIGIAKLRRDGGRLACGHRAGEIARARRHTALRTHRSPEAADPRKPGAVALQQPQRNQLLLHRCHTPPVRYRVRDRRLARTSPAHRHQNAAGRRQSYDRCGDVGTERSRRPQGSGARHRGQHRLRHRHPRRHAAHHRSADRCRALEQRDRVIPPCPRLVTLAQRRHGYHHARPHEGESFDAHRDRPRDRPHPLAPGQCV